MMFVNIKYKNAKTVMKRAIAVKTTFATSSKPRQFSTREPFYWCPEFSVRFDCANPDIKSAECSDDVWQ
jgi:hypothetical protein